MKLLYAPASPYAAKVRMAARHLGIEITEVKTDTGANSPDLTDNNPLGKIPVLIRKDAAPVYDSAAIMQYLNRQSGGALYPQDDDRRTEAEVLESLCDGIMDCLLAIVYERRSRPPEKIHQPWIDKQWEKVVRGLDYLENNPPKIGERPHGGHFALAALIGYLDLRFTDLWADGRPNLIQWPQTFTQHFSHFAEMKPSG